MRGTHLRAQMHHPHPASRGPSQRGHRLIKLARLPREVHDGKHIAALLCALQNVSGKLIDGDASIAAAILDAHPSELLEHRWRIARQLRLDAKRQRAVQCLQRRLRSRAQDSRDAAESLQEIHRRIEEMRAAHGQRLNLVKDKDAVLQRMQPPHRPRAARKKRVEELHLRREDHRRIPALRQEPPPIRPLAFPAFAVFRQHGGMVLQDRLIPIEYIADLLGVLLDDRRVGDHDDDPLLPMKLCMAQREPHGGKRLAAARRHGKPVDARRLLRRPQAIVADLPPQSGDLPRHLLLWHRKPLNLLLQTYRKLFPQLLRLPLPAQTRVQFELGAVQAIRIDQHAEQQLVHHAPREIIHLAFHRKASSDPFIERRKLADRLLEKTVERRFFDDLAMIIREIDTRQNPILLHAALEVGLPFLVDIVEKPRMMRKDHERCQIHRQPPVLRMRAIPPPQQLAARRGMIDRAPAAAVARIGAAPIEIRGKLLRALAEIMQETDQSRHLRKPDASGEPRHDLPHMEEMLRHRLPLRILHPPACKIRHHHRPSMPSAPPLSTTLYFDKQRSISFLLQEKSEDSICQCAAAVLKRQARPCLEAKIG